MSVIKKLTEYTLYTVTVREYTDNTELLKCVF